MRHLLLLLLILVPARGFAQSAEADRVSEAATVFQEIMSAPDKAIPNAILDKAEAIAVFPGTLKAGFVVGAHRGRGIVSVRDRAASSWSAPAFLTLTGGSVGAQIGGQAIDLVLIVINRRGVDSLLRSQFKLGADASVAAGPVGRDAAAATDILMRAEILSYSRARGLFAGATLSGSAVRADTDANGRFYGSALPSHDTRGVVAASGVVPPDVVQVWRDALARHVK